MKLSIIGAAGNIGSNAAFNIAIHNIADDIIMIDAYSPDKLEQYVFDVKGAVTGLDVKVEAGDYKDLAGSDIVLISAGSANVVASRMEVLKPNVPLIKDFAREILQYCPEAIVITATNPVDPLNYALSRFSGLDRRKLIGYSANDSTRFRAFVAQALGISSSRVRATVIGEHGNSQVLLFSSVRVDGRPYELSEDLKQKVRLQVTGLPVIMEGQRMRTGRTAAWTTSMGIGAVCRAIAHNTGEMIPCSVVLEGEYGCRNMGMSVPVVLGKEGVREIQEWKIAPDEQELLQRSIESLKPAMEYVEESLKGLRVP